MREATEARTTTAAVERTYYGIPPIKAPHWRWLVITYFFLAALAGGSFAISVLADLVGRDRALLRAGRYLSLAALLPCPVLLTLDLGRPERTLHMFRILKLRSPMSLGSWGLLGFGLLSGATTATQVLDDLAGSDVLAVPRRGLALLTLPFALFLSGYTGVLLAATNVPLWGRNYLLLGPTFVASAFSSSLAALSLLLRIVGSEQPDTARRLARAESISLVTELGLLLAGVARLGDLGRPLTAGKWGSLFWPVVVGGGLVVPLALLRGGAGRDAYGPSTRPLAAVLVLVGSFALRTLMIFAGRESASRPEDYFAYTGMTGGWRVPS